MQILTKITNLLTKAAKVEFYACPHSVQFSAAERDCVNIIEFARVNIQMLNEMCKPK